MDDATRGDRPASDETDETDDTPQDGQVSEVGRLEDPDQPVFPSDAVAGYPLDADEGGEGVQEGAAGPDARTGNERPRGDRREERREERKGESR